MNTLKMTSSLEALSRTGNLFAPGYWAAGTEAAMSVGSSVIKGQWGTIVDSATAAFNEGFPGDRKSVVSVKSVSVRLDLGGRRIMKPKTNQTTITTKQPH